MNVNVHRKPAADSSVVKAALANPTVTLAPEDVREFPDYPRVGVGGIVVHNGRVLLVRRGRPPLKDKWSIPGGLVEVGEKLTEAVVRELEEETGIVVDPTHILGVFERIQRGPKSGRRVRYHYVIVDYLCELRGPKPRDAEFPTLRPASDITEAEWVEGKIVSRYGLSNEAQEVIIKAMETSQARRVAQKR